MQSRSSRRAVAVAAILAGMLVAIGAGARAEAPREKVNLVYNGSFEEATRRTSLSSWVAVGWEPWFQQPGTLVEGYKAREPEFGPLHLRKDQYLHGEYSMRWFNSYGSHRAGLFQTISVPPGSTIEFSAWFNSWCSSKDVYNESDALCYKQVGIDPTGGTDPFADTVVWSEVNSEMDHWVRVAVRATVPGDKATVFLKEWGQLAVKNNTVVVDHAEAYVIAGPGETPPTPTPRPSFDPSSTATAPLLTGLDPFGEGSLSPGLPGGSFAFYRFEYPDPKLDAQVKFRVYPDTQPVLEQIRLNIYDAAGRRVRELVPLREEGAGRGILDLKGLAPGSYTIQVANYSPAPVHYRVHLFGFKAELPTETMLASASPQ